MNEELILYYVNLLIIQYKTKPNARGTIEALIGALMIYDLMRKVENGYDLETAEGIQLDVLAKYAGADRVVTGVDFSRTFYSYVDYSEPTPYVNVAGLITYTELNPPDAQYLKYDTDQQSIYSLTDNELRLIIELKIAQNNIDHSTAEIDEIIEEFFPDVAIFDDNFNMTITYIFDEQAQRLAEIAISQKALPKPAAVGLIVSFVPDINNIFGMLKYESDTPAGFIQGFNTYSDDPFGSFLKY